MLTVRDRIYEVFRAHGVTTIFGNPGSTELPFLQNFPKDFRYILGLQEASVVAMATGFSLFSGEPAIVNLHTHAGTGNAMGAIVTASYAQAPLLITAGQQDRRQIRAEPFLWGKHAEFVRPYVKWSVEPQRSVDVPETLERAFHIAMTEPCGPVFVSIFMDGLDDPCPPVETRKVAYKTAPDPASIFEFAGILSNSRKIAIVAGPQIDASGATNIVVQLAEKLNADVFFSPIAYRWSFPTDHELFKGTLPPAMGPLGERLAPYDTVLVIGADVFLYYPFVPGAVVRQSTQVLHITNDPIMASRALTGRSIVGNIALCVDQLNSLVEKRERAASLRKSVESVAILTNPPKPDFVYQELAKVFPPHVVIFEEAPSSHSFFQRHSHLNEPNSYFETASGGLGFAMPAAVGAALRNVHKRPIVAILGEGSAQYSIQSLWSASRYEAPVTFIIINNEEYAILKSFAELMAEKDIPGLDISGIDFPGLALGYGIDYREVTEPERLGQIVHEAIQSKKPNLVNIPIDPFVPPLLGRSTNRST